MKHKQQRPVFQTHLPLGDGAGGPTLISYLRPKLGMKKTEEEVKNEGGGAQIPKREPFLQIAPFQ